MFCVSAAVDEASTGFVSYTLTVHCRPHAATWRVCKRFSDFERLDAVLRREGVAPRGLRLPTKHVRRSDSAALAERAAALEEFSQACLAYEPSLSTAAVSSFFNFDQGLWQGAAASANAATKIQLGVRRRSASQQRVKAAPGEGEPNTEPGVAAGLELLLSPRTGEGKKAERGGTCTSPLEVAALDLSAAGGGVAEEGAPAPPVALAAPRRAAAADRSRRRCGALAFLGSGLAVSLFLSLVLLPPVLELDPHLASPRPSAHGDARAGAHEMPSAPQHPAPLRGAPMGAPHNGAGLRPGEPKPESQRARERLARARRAVLRWLAALWRGLQRRLRPLRLRLASSATVLRGTGALLAQMIAS